MDRNQNHSVTRKVPRNGGYTKISTSSARFLYSEPQRLWDERIEFLIESIRFVQNYMNELYKRILE